MELRLDIPNARAVQRAFAQAPDLLQDTVLRAAWSASLLLQREVMENTPSGVGAGGGLKGSIFADQPSISTEGISIAVGTAMAYAVPVEFGSRPHRPPVEPLQDWVEAKLGLKGDAARRAAWAIAGKIAREGTEGAFMFTLALEMQAPQIERLFAQGVERLVEAMARQAKTRPGAASRAQP